MSGRVRIDTQSTFDEAVRAVSTKVDEILTDDGVPPAKVTAEHVIEGRARSDSFYEAPTLPRGRLTLAAADREPLPLPRLAQPASLSAFSLTPSKAWTARPLPTPRSSGEPRPVSKHALPSAPWIFGLIAVGGLATFAAVLATRSTPRRQVRELPVAAAGAAADAGVTR